MPKIESNVFIGLPLSRMILRGKKDQIVKTEPDEIKLNIKEGKREIDETILSRSDFKAEAKKIRESNITCKYILLI